MSNQFISHLSSELNKIRSEGLFKKERVINTPQSGTVIMVKKLLISAQIITLVYLTIQI